jgi:hypothetical protein
MSKRIAGKNSNFYMRASGIDYQSIIIMYQIYADVAK